MCLNNFIITPKPGHFSCPNKTAPVECSAGSYAASGSIECQPCPKGASCPTKGLSTYVLCSNGTYSDAESLSDCKVCPAGFQCPSVGMEAPEECANGTYSNTTGARYCILCPEGHRWGFVYTQDFSFKKKNHVCSIEIGQILTFTKLIMVMYVTFRIYIYMFWLDTRILLSDPTFYI